MTAPLIVTLALESEAQERFGSLRRQHFPVERNHLGAHVTLFHHLPGDELEAVRADLERACDTSAFDVSVTEVRFLGRGVAYGLSSPELAALRASLATAWDHWLTPQDRQSYRPHITVQNKVTPERSRELHTQLAAHFVPETVGAVGLDLWHYLGGPWQHAGRYGFRAG